MQFTIYTSPQAERRIAAYRRRETSPQAERHAVAYRRREKLKNTRSLKTELSFNVTKGLFLKNRLRVNANAETKHLFYCFPLGNRLWRFPRSRSKPALRPPYVFFTPFLRKRKTPKQNICETNRLISWPLGQVVKTSPFHGGNMGSNPVGVTTSWGYSSAGRARALQARGHRFEPCCPHQQKSASR